MLAVRFATEAYLDSRGSAPTIGRRSWCHGTVPDKTLVASRQEDQIAPLGRRHRYLPPKSWRLQDLFRLGRELDRRQEHSPQGTANDGGDPVRLVGVREAQAQLSGLVSKSQKERIILTRHGKPVAVLSGVEGMDVEDVLLGQDRGFARPIQSRRRSRKPLLTLDEVKARLAGSASTRRRSRSNRSRTRRSR